MFAAGPDAEWEKYGVLEPYYGVYGDEKYKVENLDESALAEFFESGAKDLGFVLDNIRDHVDGEFRPVRVLDFGCGVRRMVVPMARVCRHVVGVDIADSMLEEARRNCARHGLDNVELVKSDDRLSRVAGEFDLVHSLIVFQHMAVRRGLAVFKELVARLGDGGIGVLHFTYSRRASRLRKVIHFARKAVPGFNGVLNLAQGREFSYPAMQMNNYDLNEVFRELHESGCGNVHVRFDDHQGHMSVIVFFQKSLHT